MGFKIKIILAFMLDILHISDLLLFLLNKKYNNNYIRAINYHHVEDSKSFEKQISFYNKLFHFVDYHCFTSFLNGQVVNSNKPGLIISFDDGYEDNYFNAVPILNKFNVKGFFMVSADLIGKDGYMTVEQLKEMISQGHIIGCHTCTHHRMNKSDSEDLLNYEIITSKQKLEQLFSINIDIFCWCGGEKHTYTSEAAAKIKKAGYKYSFMTNSYPIIPATPKLQLQRSNIECKWSNALVKFQLCGIMDFLYINKRNYICRITSI